MTTWEQLLTLTKNLISCKSITPNDENTLSYIIDALKLDDFALIILKEKKSPCYNLLALHYKYANNSQKERITSLLHTCKHLQKDNLQSTFLDNDTLTNCYFKEFVDDAKKLQESLFDKNYVKNFDSYHDNEDSPFTLFLGHTDVVVAQDLDSWLHDPYSLTEENNKLYGRGIADMKGACACMTLALKDFTNKHSYKGLVGILLTTNEEGDGKGGIKSIAQLLKDYKLIPNYAIVGEPSSNTTFGDVIKTGRRGSLTLHATINGIGGHVAYPHLIDNPIVKASLLINKLTESFDDENPPFPKTSFQVTNIKSGTGAENMVGSSCYFMCNWRFNPKQSYDSIVNFVNECVAELKLNDCCDLKFVLNGNPFVSNNEKLLKAFESSIYEINNIKAVRECSGGTSDARFIAPLGSATLEFGLVSKTIHKVNEMSDKDDLWKLYEIFFKVLEKIYLK